MRPASGDSADRAENCAANRERGSNRKTDHSCVSSNASRFHAYCGDIQCGRAVSHKTGKRAASYTLLFNGSQGLHDETPSPLPENLPFRLRLSRHLLFM